MTAGFRFHNVVGNIIVLELSQDQKATVCQRQTQSVSKWPRKAVTNKQTDIFVLYKQTITTLFIYEIAKFYVIFLFSCLLVGLIAYIITSIQLDISIDRLIEFMKLQPHLLFCYNNATDNVLGVYIGNHIGLHLVLRYRLYFVRFAQHYSLRALAG